MMGTLVVNFAVEVNVSLQRLEKYFNFEEIITIHVCEIKLLTALRSLEIMMRYRLSFLIATLFGIKTQTKRKLPLSLNHLLVVVVNENPKNPILQ